MGHEYRESPESLAEQAGAHEMFRALDAMRQAPTQAERLRILHKELATLIEDGNVHAAAGASVMLIGWLDRAMGVDHGL